MFDPNTIQGLFFYTFLISAILSVLIVWGVVRLLRWIAGKSILVSFHLAKLSEAWDKVYVWWWKKRNT